MPLRLTRLMNMALRSGTLGIRFLFIFFLARYLDPASVGYYGLFTASISYGMYFVGLDFYIYNNREIIRAGDDRRGQMLKGQAVLSALLYAAFLPIMLLVLHHAGWPAHLIWWFVPILVLEHFNQEVFRLLVAISQQISASLLMFVRQGSWGLAAVVLMQWNAESRQLDVIMALWTFSGVVAAVLGVAKLTRLGMDGWRLPVDWIWIRKGIVLCASFLVATLALRGIQTVDRYWLEALGGIEVVGAYVLFLGMTGALMVFLDAGIFAYAYPELIRLAHEGKRALSRKLVRQMLVQTLVLCAAFAVVSWFVLPFLLDWIDNPVYKDAIQLYPWVLIAMIINALGMVPHYALYAYGKDRPIIYSHLAALPAFVLSTWLASIFQPVLAVPIGLAVSFTAILIFKTIAFWLIDRDAGAAKPSASSS